MPAANNIELVKALAAQAFLQRKLMAALFVALSGMALLLGLVWPRNYTSATTILVDEKNIIQPLMQGAAVATEAIDRGRIAREIIYGSKIMGEVLAFGGWTKGNPSEAERDKLIKGVLTPRTTVTNVGRNLIRIEYSDPDPKRAFAITQKLAELFIAESFDAKARESTAAYQFIDKQVQEYHEKLMKAEHELKEFRSANIDARPGSETEVAARINALQTRVEQTSQELQEAEIRKTSLEKQLSGEAETATAFTREGQFRTRIAELSRELDTLRLNFHDTHPDIVRLRHQIEDLERSLAEERSRRQANREAAVVDQTVMMNPLYQQLRRDLSQAQTTIDTLRARLTETRRLLQMELDRGRRVHGGEVTLAELTRDYEVNRDIYQDLLRRRENARVSMNLDLEKQGLIFRIHEPAYTPHEPSGLRFMHFVFIGVALGLLAPLGVLYAKHRLDPRVRSESLLADKLKLPVFAVIPHLPTPVETQSALLSVRNIVFALGAYLLVLATVVWIKVAGVIG